MINGSSIKDLGIQAGLSLPTARIARVLNKLLELRSKPIVIRCDNRPELIIHEFTGWTKKHDIRIEYMQPW